MTVKISYRTEDVLDGTMHIAEAVNAEGLRAVGQTFEPATHRTQHGALYTSYAKRKSLQELLDALIHRGVL